VRKDRESRLTWSSAAILSYGDLLKDWRGELRRLRLGTVPDHGCIWPNSPEDAAEQIDGFLNSALRHHALTDADIISDPVTSGWIADIHDALRQLKCNPAASAALATFDRVRCEFDRAAPVIDRVQRDMRARLEAQLNGLTQQVEDLRRQLSLASHNRWQRRMAQLRQACAAFLKQNAIP
jgi:hypothetical protein